MLYELVFWIVAIPAVYLTGVSKSGFAGGIGVITVPLMSLVINPILAAAIMLPLLIFMDALSVRAWWGKHSKALYFLLFPAAVLGIATGYLLADYLNEALIKLILGIMALFFSVWGLFLSAKIKISLAPVWGRVAGFVSGFTSFLAHAGGPPMNFYLIPLKLEREVFLATAVVFLASVNLIKLMPYFSLGYITSVNLFTALLLAPFAWLGVKSGLKIQKLCDDALFYKIVMTILLLVSIKLIFDSL